MLPTAKLHLPLSFLSFSHVPAGWKRLPIMCQLAGSGCQKPYFGAARGRHPNRNPVPACIFPNRPPVSPSTVHSVCLPRRTAASTPRPQQRLCRLGLVRGLGRRRRLRRRRVASQHALHHFAEPPGGENPEEDKRASPHDQHERIVVVLGTAAGKARAPHSSSVKCMKRAGRNKQGAKKEKTALPKKTCAFSGEV